MLAPDLATAVGYGDKPASRHLRLISRRPLAKGALHGFCTIELLPLGLRSIHCPVLVSDGRAWCALPQNYGSRIPADKGPMRAGGRFMPRL